MTQTKFVTSKDGTRIAYETSGSGPALLVVNGALGYRASYSRKMAKALAKRFTVIDYDRRGRGESGDTKPYAVEREVEDVRALVEQAAGGKAFVFGMSSGAALALEAAASGVPMRGLAAYEPPYMVGDPKDRPDPDFRERLQAFVDRGERDEAVKYFMRTVGVPGFVLVIMRLLPFWKDLRAAAHTLPYDAAVMDGFGLPAKRLAEVRVRTLVMAGDKTTPTLKAAADATAKAIPGATHRMLPKQNHGVAGEAVAPVLAEFFGA